MGCIVTNFQLTNENFFVLDEQHNVLVEILHVECLNILVTYVLHHVCIIFYGDESYSQHLEAIILSWSVVLVLQLSLSCFRKHFCLAFLDRVCFLKYFVKKF